MSRPAFLAGGFAFYLLGVALAWAAGTELDLGALILGQIVITSIQLATHYSNEYFDLPADQLNPNPTFWAGGSRVLPQGVLPRWSALAAALVCTAVALAVIAGLGRADPATPLMLLALALGWSYSAPPLRLESSGLGEVNVALVTSGLTPLIAYVLQVRCLDVSAALAVLPLCLLQVPVSMAANFPDVEGDRLAGKRTLVVRLGERSAAQLYALLVLAAFAALPLQLVAGLPRLVPLAVGLTLPLALWVALNVGRGRWIGDKRWDRLCFWTNGLSLATVGLMAAALLAPLLFAS